MYNIPINKYHLCAGPLHGGGLGTCIVSSAPMFKYRNIFPRVCLWRCTECWIFLNSGGLWRSVAVQLRRRALVSCRHYFLWKRLCQSRISWRVYPTHLLYSLDPRQITVVRHNAHRHLTTSCFNINKTQSLDVDYLSIVDCLRWSPALVAGHVLWSHVHTSSSLFYWMEFRKVVLVAKFWWPSFSVTLILLLQRYKSPWIHVAILF